MTRLRITLAIAACSSLTACASSPNTEVGVRIGDETLKQFKAGVTTESWLVAILGPPTSCSRVLDVENTFVYRYSSGSESSGLISSLTGKSSRNTAVNYFIITDGIVTRFWADRAIERTALGTPVPSEPGAKQTEPSQP